MAEFMPNDPYAYQSEMTETDDFQYDEGLEAGQNLGLWRKIGTIATATGLVLSSSLYGSSEAEAATPTCYGDYCSGQYADATGCDANATTITTAEISGLHTGLSGEERDIRIGTLELRYSAQCGTKWARFNAERQSGVYVVRVQKADGYTQSRVISLFGSSPPGVSYTPMIYTPKDNAHGYVEGGELTKSSTEWK